MGFLPPDSSFFPWDIRLQNLTSTTLPPNMVQLREPLLHTGDNALLGDNNTVVRTRDYTSDGHNYRQEVVLGAGTGAGTYIAGNDFSSDPSFHLTYADVIEHVGSTMNLKIPAGQLLWNDSPLNPDLDPNTTILPPFQIAQQAFEVAQAVAEPSSVADAISSIQGIQDLVNQVGGGIIPNGAVDFSSPYASYCSLFGTKIPMLNFAAIMFLQLLFSGTPGLLQAGLIPITLGPVGLALLPLMRTNWNTAYNASVAGTIIGKELQSFMLASVPGVGAAFSGGA